MTVQDGSFGAGRSSYWTGFAVNLTRGLTDSANDRAQYDRGTGTKKGLGRAVSAGNGGRAFCG